MKHCLASKITGDSLFSWLLTVAFLQSGSLFDSCRGAMMVDMQHFDIQIQFLIIGVEVLKVRQHPGGMKLDCSPWKSSNMPLSGSFVLIYYVLKPLDFLLRCSSGSVVLRFLCFYFLRVYKNKCGTGVVNALLQWLRISLREFKTFLIQHSKSCLIVLVIMPWNKWQGQFSVW